MTRGRGTPPARVDAVARVADLLPEREAEQDAREQRGALAVLPGLHESRPRAPPRFHRPVHRGRRAATLLLGGEVEARIARESTARAPSEEGRRQVRPRCRRRHQRRFCAPGALVFAFRDTSVGPSPRHAFVEIASRESEQPRGRAHPVAALAVTGNCLAAALPREPSRSCSPSRTPQPRGRANMRLSKSRAGNPPKATKPRGRAPPGGCSLVAAAGGSRRKLSPRTLLSYHSRLAMGAVCVARLQRRCSAPLHLERSMSSCPSPTARRGRCAHRTAHSGRGPRLRPERVLGGGAGAGCRTRVGSGSGDCAL